MVTNVSAIIVDKSLIKAMRTTICTTLYGGARTDNLFCSSDMARWPAFPQEMTRLAYPEDQNSVPGTTYFCDGLFDWLHEISDAASPTPMTSRMSEEYQHLLERHFGSMEKLGEFCKNVESAEHPAPTPSETERRDAGTIVAVPGGPITPPSPPPGSSIFTDIGDFITENTNAIIYTISALTVAAGSLTVALKKFRTNFVKLLRAVLSFENITKLFKQPQIDIQPNTVSGQTLGLAAVPQVAEYGIFFRSLPRQAQAYASEQAIVEWEALWRITKNVFLNLDKNNPHISYGLPETFIQAFAKKFLKLHKEKALLAAASNWLAKKYTDAPPVESQVLDQLLSIRPALRHGTLKFRDILARRAIERWRAFPLSEKAVFVDLTVAIRRGELPQNYLVDFLSNGNIDAVRRIADEETRVSTPVPGTTPVAPEITIRTRHLDTIIPKPNTVIVLLEKMATSGQFPFDGSKFLSEDEIIKLYVAQLAIDDWMGLKTKDRAAAFAYATAVEDLDVIESGGVPQRFLTKFLNEYLKDVEALQALRGKAMEWAKALTESTATLTLGDADKVKAQLVRLGVSSSHPQLGELADAAVMDWITLDIQLRRLFVNIRHDIPEGELPEAYLKNFISKHVENASPQDEPPTAPTGTSTPSSSTNGGPSGSTGGILHRIMELFVPQGAQQEDIAFVSGEIAFATNAGEIRMATPEYAAAPAGGAHAAAIGGQILFGQTSPAPVRFAATSIFRNPLTFRGVR